MNLSETIDQKEQAIIEEFSIFDDPMDRYAYLIDIGKKMPDFPVELQRDELLVPGCQSKVWLSGKLEDGRIDLLADSNTAITRGIIALLLRVLSGQTPAAIRQAQLHFLEAIQLREHLSSQRANGLASMIQRIKQLATHLDESDHSAAKTARNNEPRNNEPRNNER